MSLRKDIGTMLRTQYEKGTMPAPQVIDWDEERELDAIRPLIKVYMLNAPAEFKGLGATHRKVMHRATIDLKCRSEKGCEFALQEILRILGKNCITPWPGFSQMEYDDGTQHAGYSGFYWWTIELKLWEPRKPTGRV